LCLAARPDVYLIDGTYELFRDYYALPSASDQDARRQRRRFPGAFLCDNAAGKRRKIDRARKFCHIIKRLAGQIDVFQ
jgi:hypothetical protein